MGEQRINRPWCVRFKLQACPSVIYAAWFATQLEAENCWWGMQSNRSRPDILWANPPEYSSTGSVRGRVRYHRRTRRPILFT